MPGRTEEVGLIQARMYDTLHREEATSKRIITGEQ